MAHNVLTEVLGVRSLLADPLNNAPSMDDIIEALEEVYQYVTNLTNNTGNAWQVDTLTISTTAGTREYQLDSEEVVDFYKALRVTTVPPDDSNPEYILEFTEVEQLSREWSWLGQNNGQLFSSSHSAQVIAFYRKLGTDGEELWCEFRPTPNADEDYKVLYQVGDWWDRVFAQGDMLYSLPNREYRFHLRRLAAELLLPKTQWSYDKVADNARKMEIASVLSNAIARGSKAFDEHIASLDNADILQLDVWSDTQDGYNYR